jgi:hypothetical protein
MGSLELWRRFWSAIYDAAYFMAGGLMPSSLFPKNQMERRIRRFETAFAGLIWAATRRAAICLMICAVGVLAIQGAYWLHDGYWTGWQFRLAWEYVGFTEKQLEFKGVEKIRTWILDMPLSVGVAM